MKQVVSQRDDIAFYILLYPIAHQDKMEIVSTIMCGKDNAERLKLLDEMIETGKAGKDGCEDNTVTKNIAFGIKNKIFSTPSIFFEDGSRYKGAIEASTIINKVDGLNKQQNN